MLGNWSFGDYFKKEAIEWAWELIVDEWDFPPERLYATVYSPDKAKGDPADFDRKPGTIWAAKFEAHGLDPAVHIVNGNKKDNFWMMGDTGPCGPCSELHVDLTPAGDTRGTPRQHGRPPLHRNLEPRLHPIQRQPRRHLRPAPGPARRHRHGLRARRQHHPGHEKLHRLRQRPHLQLRHRHLPPHLRRPRRNERQNLPQHPPWQHPRPCARSQRPLQPRRSRPFSQK